MDKDDSVERYEDSSMICVFCFFFLSKYSKNICILNARAPGTANGKVLQPATFGKTAKTKKKNTRSVEILGSWDQQVVRVFSTLFSARCSFSFSFSISFTLFVLRFLSSHALTAKKINNRSVGGKS